jgi:hypothetical protein
MLVSLAIRDKQVMTTMLTDHIDESKGVGKARNNLCTLLADPFRGNARLPSISSETTMGEVEGGRSRRLE